MKVIDTRRSVREYNDKEVSEKEIKKILDAAMQAPSARNGQPWEFLVVKDKEKKERIASLVPSMRMASSASFLIIFLINKERLIAPLYAEQDLASSVTTAMLEARSLGIGSVWCGVTPVPEKMKNVSEVFEINDDRYQPFALVCFGYPKNVDVFVKAKRYDKKRIHQEVL